MARKFCIDCRNAAAKHFPDKTDSELYGILFDFTAFPAACVREGMGELLDEQLAKAVKILAGEEEFSMFDTPEQESEWKREREEHYKKEMI